MYTYMYTHSHTHTLTNHTTAMHIHVLEKLESKT